MKKKQLVSAVLFLMSFTPLFSVAQQAFIAKWAPASLLAGKVTVGGEYNYSRKNSVTLLVGIPAAVKHSVDYDNRESEMESKAFSVMAGYRRYLGKKPHSGMYIEPYAKYLKHESEGILEATLDFETARFATTTKYEGYGLGAQIGAQFLIADKVAIDLFFLGPEANISRFSSNSIDIASNIPWTAVEATEAEQDIREAIDDIPFLKNNTEIEVSQAEKRVSTKFDGFLPGFRFGISVGIRL